MAPIRVGDKYNRLTVLKRLSPTGAHHTKWLVRCECGEEREVFGTNLRTGTTKACGCLNRELASKLHERYKGSVKHGLCHVPEWRVWTEMKRRCRNAKRPGFHLYGGRGIKVCKRWLESFANFYADMGPRPSPKHSIDRIDVNGNYGPHNCRWATQTEQARNTRHNRTLEHEGRKQTVAAWAEETGISRDVIGMRIDRLGWSVKDALTKPVAITRPRRKP